MGTLERLEQIFTEFPGIGPRQAKRFAAYLLRKRPALRHELARLVAELDQSVMQCPACLRFFERGNNKLTVCSICANESRDKTLLLVVEKDVDVESVERSGSYKGYYFVLGGLVPLASDEPDRFVRFKELVSRLEKDKAGIKELILGFSATTEGDHTHYIALERFTPIAEKNGFKITALGRGLSTGTELEYSDPETLKNALARRS